MIYKTDDLRICEIKELVSPAQIHEQLPLSAEGSALIYDTRQKIHNIMRGNDDRLLVVVGPCSIHDVEAAHEYAGKLKTVRDELQDNLEVIMRVYFEKPRTTVGWKGLINDPDLDESFHINKGLAIARELLLYLNDMGMPAGTEYLDLISPQYIADLISWGAIGARTTESQGHRTLASGLSCPVGFKNGTDGNLKIAVDAVAAALRPHHFLSVTKEGRTAIFSTSGNEDCHVILRGGTEPNYDADHVAAAVEQMTASSLKPCVMIDFSHANSSKIADRQALVCADVAQQIADGNRNIMGVMIESHLLPGRQEVQVGKSLRYGQSITDACIGWNETIPLLRDLASAVHARRQKTGQYRVASSA